MPTYRSVVDKRPVQQSMPGSSVVFQIYQDLAPVSTPLSEIVDPDAVALPATTTISVTLLEYGNATLVTRKLRLLSLSDVDPATADILAFNMVDSLDRLIMNVALGGSNVLGENGGAMKLGGAFSRTAVVDTDTFKSRNARAAVAQLRGRNALPRMEDLFVGYIHPDVSYDLRSESNLAAWRPPHEYSSAGNIWAGAIGAYEGTHIPSGITFVYVVD
jgi:N4-gp56 family major capsid protein